MKIVPARIKFLQAVLHSVYQERLTHCEKLCNHIFFTDASTCVSVQAHAQVYKIACMPVCLLSTLSFQKPIFVLSNHALSLFPDSDPLKNKHSMLPQGDYINRKYARWRVIKLFRVCDCIFANMRMTTFIEQYTAWSECGVFLLLKQARQLS